MVLTLKERIARLTRSNNEDTAGGALQQLYASASTETDKPPPQPASSGGGTTAALGSRLDRLRQHVNKNGATVLSHSQSPAAKATSPLLSQSTMPPAAAHAAAAATVRWSTWQRNVAEQSHKSSLLPKLTASKLAELAAFAPPIGTARVTSTTAGALEETFDDGFAAVMHTAVFDTTPLSGAGTSRKPRRRRGSATSASLGGSPAVRARPGSRTNTESVMHGRKRAKKIDALASRLSTYDDLEFSSGTEGDEEEEEDVEQQQQGSEEDKEPMIDGADDDDDVAGNRPAGNKRRRLAASKSKQSEALNHEAIAKASLDLDALLAEDAAAISDVAAPAPDFSQSDDWTVVMDEYGEDFAMGTEEPWLELTVPGNIARRLRPYQRAGVRFLLGSYARGRGAVLADDMGLGKTLQSIAFMAAILGKTGNDVGDKNFPELHPLQSIVPPDADGRPGADVAACPRFSPDYSGTGAPILVVATASLLDNWMREMGKWGTFRAIKLHGPSMDRGLAAVRSGGKEVAITTYTAVRIHIEKFETIPWHVVFFDEAHTLKNDKTATYTAANRLPTRLRFGLTGTVFQNRHSEMFCLLDLLCYGCLGEKGEFEVNVEKPIKVGMRSDASNAEMAESKAAIARLRSALKPILLRRKKDIIQHQLPKKTEHVVFCELAPMQLAAYRRVLALQDVELVLNAKQPCPCGSKKPRFSCQECEGGYWKVNEDQGGVLYPHYHYCDCSDVYDKHANPNGCKRHNPDGCWRHSKFGHQRICPFCLCLPIISLLRNVALHLDLVKADPADNNDVKRREFEWKIELAEAVLGQDLNALGGPVQDARLVTLTETTSCGKLAVLKSLLQKWAHDQAGSRGRVHKVLIFSSVVRMLKVVRAVAEAEGYEHMYLDGATPQGERQPLVDAFNHPDSSAFLFLASTLAGGVGLNLTAANKVIILDPNWNPAADLQAQDRAFRIGQDRDVDVYRFVAAGTLEETMWLRQLSKQQHAAIAVEGSDAERRLFSGMERSKNGKYDGVDGEIFGMVNLLRHDVDRVRALEVLEGKKDESGDARGKTAGGGCGGEAEEDASQLENNNDDRRHTTTDNRQHKIEYRIETLDAEKVAQLALERRGKQAVPNKGTDGSAFGKDDEHASDIDDEDLLLRACGAAAVVPSSKLRLAAKPRGGAKEVDRLAGLDADRAAAAIAAKLDPNRPAYRTARQRKVAGEVAQAVSEIQPASGVSCLARWLGISIKDAAKALLDLDPENRARLRERYAEEAPMGLMPRY